MFITRITDEEKKIYGIFSVLREFAKDANILTLKQISFYIARTISDLNINRDLNISVNNNSCYELLLIDGRKIVFSNDSNKFGFRIIKNDQSISVSIVISEMELGNLTTASVYSEIRIRDNGMYVISFRPKDMSDNSLKFVKFSYYMEDEINWVHEIVKDEINSDFDIVAKQNLIYPFAHESYFVLSPESLSLDCFDGYILNTLTMVDLLYNNIKVVKNCVLKRKLKEKNKI